MKLTAAAFCSLLLLTSRSDATDAQSPAILGASVPYLRYEAEAGSLEGRAEKVGPSRSVGDLGGEASGREAVKLTRTGDGVEWTATADANSIVVRNCIPDSPDGNGQNASLSVYVDGVKKASLNLSSRYSWLYGPEADPKNTPELGSPRRIYDESHQLFGFTIKKGQKVRLQKDAGDSAEYYGIDFVELELVPPPAPCPVGFVNLVDEGVSPADFSAKIGGLLHKFATDEAYRGKKGLYIPPGDYPMSGHVTLDSRLPNGFEIRGAGKWYSRLTNDSDIETGPGNPGFDLNGRSVKLTDFAIFGGGRTRDGGGKPFFNSYGDGTVITRLWIEHMTCGFWVGGPQGITNNLTIQDCRLRDLGADGINFCNGTKNSRVLNTTVRGSGDDGIAIWSAPEMDGPAGGIDYVGCAHNVIENCTVELPWRADAFAIYGGQDNTIRNCVARDTLTYAGLNISSTFKPRPFAGTTLVEHVLLERCGGSFWSGQQFGALWVNADDSPIPGVICRDIDIRDATYSGIMLCSETNGKPGYAFNVQFENIRVKNPGTYGIFIRDGTGTARFKNTHLEGALRRDEKQGASPIQMDIGKDCSGFTAAR